MAIVINGYLATRATFIHSEYRLTYSSIALETPYGRTVACMKGFRSGKAMSIESIEFARQHEELDILQDFSNHGSQSLVL